MKFFTIFLSFTLQFDIFTSKELDLLFMILHEVYLPIPGSWLSPFLQHMNKIHPNILCQYLRRAPLIMIQYQSRLQKLQKRWFLEKHKLQNKSHKASFIHYYDTMNRRVQVPTLACSFGESEIHIARYSEYKDFVVFIKELNQSTQELIGTVKKPFSIRMTESNALKTFIDVFENRYPDSQLDNEEKPDTLFSLNDLNSWNLCASLYWHLFRNTAHSDEGMSLRTLYKIHQYIINQKPITINVLLCCNTRNREYLQFYVTQDPTKKRHIFVLHPNEDRYAMDHNLTIVQFEIL